jgi:hypothetical protein
VGWGWVYLIRRPLSGLLYQPRMIDDECGNRSNENWQGKPKYSEKTCPSATLSTTNPTWLDLGSNPGRRSDKPATNRLRYGTATNYLWGKKTDNSNSCYKSLVRRIVRRGLVMWQCLKSSTRIHNIILNNFMCMFGNADETTTKATFHGFTANCLLGAGPYVRKSQL